MGVTKDLIQACVWYDIAAQMGDDLGAGLKRDELLERMSQEEVASAQQMALTWLSNFESAASN